MNGNVSDSVFRASFARLGRRFCLGIAVALATIAFSGPAQACAFWDVKCIAKKAAEELKKQQAAAAAAAAALLLQQQQAADAAALLLQQQQAAAAAAALLAQQQAAAEQAARDAAAEAERLAAIAQDTFKKEVIKLLGNINGKPFIDFVKDFTDMKSQSVGDAIDSNFLNLLKDINSPDNPIRKVILKNKSTSKPDFIFIDDLFIPRATNDSDKTNIDYLSDVNNAKNVNEAYYDKGADSDFVYNTPPYLMWGFSLATEATFRVRSPKIYYLPPMLHNFRVSFPLYIASGPKEDKTFQWFAGKTEDKKVFYVNVVYEVHPIDGFRNMKFAMPAAEYSANLVCRNDAESRCMVTQMNYRGHVDFVQTDWKSVIANIAIVGAAVGISDVSGPLKALVGMDGMNFLQMLINMYGVDGRAVNGLIDIMNTTPVLTRNAIRDFVRTRPKVYSELNSEGLLENIPMRNNPLADVPSTIEEALTTGVEQVSSEVENALMALEVDSVGTVPADTSIPDFFEILQIGANGLSKFTGVGAAEENTPGLKLMKASIAEPEFGFTWLNPHAMDQKTLDDIQPGFESNHSPDYVRLSMAGALALGFNLNFNDQDKDYAMRFQGRIMPAMVGGAVLPITERGKRNFKYVLW